MMDCRDKDRNVRSNDNHTRIYAAKDGKKNLDK